MNHKKPDIQKIKYGNIGGNSYGNVFKFHVSCGTYSTSESRLKFKKIKLPPIDNFRF